MTETHPLAAVEVIEANLAAYNARDIDGFMRWFAGEVEVIDQKTGAVVMRGLAEVRRFYAVLFETSPALHSHVLQRVAVGGFVVDQEHVTGRAGGDVLILITYDVRDGRIRRVWFVREPLPDAVSLRRATVRDTDAVVAIGVETYREHFTSIWSPLGLRDYLAREYDRGAIERELASDDCRYLLAERAGGIVGFAKLRFPRPVPTDEASVGMELQKIYVRGSAVSGGTGARLLLEAVAQARELRCSLLWLAVLVRNARAQRFYERHGFAVAGELAFATDLGPDPMVIMRRSV
jgi:ribosomal protein S18 acetylase RimI-like enzyme